ncbi:MAG: hypothetical protein AB7L90_04970 [Hyphomicrobiaceae bacterium]
MNGGRFLILLIVIAAGLFAAALAISTGDGIGVAGSGTGPTPPQLDWMRAAAALADSFAPSSRGEVSALLIGFFAGWLLRWLYSLPWSSVPRAIADWLLGWRTSAIMVSLAVGCTVILLFY